MSSANHHVHITIVDRSADRASDAANIYPPRASTAKVRKLINIISTHVRGVIVSLFSILWGFFKEYSPTAQMAIADIIIFYVLALFADSYFLRTPQEWFVGAVSLACVTAITYVTYAIFLEWRDARETKKPAVEDIEHLKAGIKAVNEEGKIEKKRSNLPIPRLSDSPVPEVRSDCQEKLEFLRA